jgi:hypothetical protein
MRNSAAPEDTHGERTAHKHAWLEGFLRLRIPLRFPGLQIAKPIMKSLCNVLYDAIVESKQWTSVSRR